MQLVKHSNESTDIMPLLAALSYSVILDEGEDKMEESGYDPTSQRTIYGMGRDYSTSRSEDSAGGFLHTKSDTKKDD
jgi:hypothetical protein